MNRYFPRLVSLVFCALFSASSFASEGSIPHWDLSMTGSEYRPLLDSQKHRQQLDGSEAAADTLKPVLDAGKRNLDWLAHLNSLRAPDNQISISSEATQQGYPVDSPRVYNPSLILSSFGSLRTSLPKSMQDIILDGAAFTDTPAMADSDYADAALRVDRIYQMAARWNLMKPFLSQLTGRKKSDVRSFLTLSADTALQQKLTNFEQLSTSEQQALEKQLVELCYNDPALAEAFCKQEFAQARRQKNLSKLYARRLPAAQKLYANFFIVPVTRSDVTWNSQNPWLMTVPFQDPGRSDVLSFLKVNIEDEWRWQDWKLQLDFQSGWNWNITHVEFVPGSTPHVNGLAGSTITMDGNAPLTEYDVRWTIRHEYGHVLGFPDCYIEFWDPSVSAIVSYQLDTSNLMCSRRGHLQQKHYDELKRVYFR